MHFISVRITAFKIQCRRKKISIAQGKGHRPGEYRCPGKTSLHNLCSVYDKFLAELPGVAHSSPISSWHSSLVNGQICCSALFFLSDWSQYPTTRVSNTLKTDDHIGWHHPKPTVPSLWQPLHQRVPFHTTTEALF